MNTTTPIPKNTICLWYNKDALDAARFYAATFPDSKVTAVHHAPSDYPSGKAGDVPTVEFTVLGLPCPGLNGGPDCPHSEAFSFQVATDTQEETDRDWNAIGGGLLNSSARCHTSRHVNFGPSQPGGPWRSCRRGRRNFRFKRLRSSPATRRTVAPRPPEPGCARRPRHARLERTASPSLNSV